MTRPLLRALVALLIALAAGLALAQDAAPTEEPDCPPFPAGVGQDFSYYVGQGDSRFARMNYSAAALSYTCAIRLAPDYAPAFARRGYAYAALGDSDRAFSDYEQALTLDETFIPAYVNRGALYTRVGNFGLAINDLTLAISLDPNNIAALDNRAVVHAIEGNYDLALDDLNAAIQIDAGDALAYATRAAVYSALASRDYQQFVANSGSNQLPAGTPGDVIAAVDDSIRTGDFSIWLSLLTPNGTAN